MFTRSIIKYMMFKFDFCCRCCVGGKSHTNDLSSARRWRTPLPGLPGWSDIDAVAGAAVLASATVLLSVGCCPSPATSVCAFRLVVVAVVVVDTKVDDAAGNRRANMGGGLNCPAALGSVPAMMNAVAVVSVTTPARPAARAPPAMPGGDTIQGQVTGSTVQVAMSSAMLSPMVRWPVNSTMCSCRSAVFRGSVSHQGHERNKKKQQKQTNQAFSGLGPGL